MKKKTETIVSADGLYIANLSLCQTEYDVYSRKFTNNTNYAGHRIVEGSLVAFVHADGTISKQVVEGCYSLDQFCKFLLNYLQK